MAKRIEDAEDAVVDSETGDRRLGNWTTKQLTFDGCVTHEHSNVASGKLQVAEASPFWSWQPGGTPVELPLLNCWLTEELWVRGVGRVSGLVWQQTEDGGRRFKQAASLLNSRRCIFENLQIIRLDARSIDLCGRRLNCNPVDVDADVDADVDVEASANCCSIKVASKTGWGFGINLSTRPCLAQRSGPQAMRHCNMGQHVETQHFRLRSAWTRVQFSMDMDMDMGMEEGSSSATGGKAKPQAL
ncbi:hypothetical protein ACLKA6_018099 [Drosophila palustris]